MAGGLRLLALKGQDFRPKAFGVRVLDNGLQPKVLPKAYRYIYA